MAALSSGKAARFVVIRLSSFGDVVLAEPVARRLRQGFPASRIDFAVYEEFAEIPALFDGLTSVIACPRGAPEKAAAAARAFGPIDVVIDLQASPRSRKLAGALRGGRTLRYRRPYLRRFLAVYLPRIWKGALEHTVDLYLSALRPLGIEAQGDSPVLVVPERASRQAAEALGDGALVGLCPGASSSHKMWGTERFRSLARDLAGRGYRVALVGSQRDAAAVDAARPDSDGRRIARFVTGSIEDLAAALARCRVTVSNDSGLLHLAAAAGSNVVAIFGPTSPILGFAPRSPGCRVVSRDLACSPCSYHGNRPCKYGKPVCLETIDPSEVASIVDEIMRS